MKRTTRPSRSGGEIPKTRTGITGLDEMTKGGLPAGRPTLLCGSAGSGKTLLATEFIVRGATEFGEPGVMMMFEENAKELKVNVRSLGFDLDRLIAKKLIALEHVPIERSEIEETGEYDLEGLFIRLGHAIDTIGAKRVVLDTVEALFAGLPNHAILRAELRRLFRWLKDRGVTAIITGERGDETLTRYGLEEYVADCVIVLDQRLRDQVSTRRLRILKYRGSSHGTNEYPFIIGDRGFSVLPITSLQLDHRASSQRLRTGVPELDEMLGGKGIFRGSSVLISGAAGTGKSSLGASFVRAACLRGERAMLFAYEESSDQLLRNMRSIGIDLAPLVATGLLEIISSRPTLLGLEQHLVTMHDAVTRFNPRLIVVDPISNLSLVRHETEVKMTLMRLIDFLKHRQITALFVNLTANSGPSPEDSQMGVSSLMDTWLWLRNVESNGERNRLIYVLKSRGMAHSNQVREFVLSDTGISLVDVYLGADRVLTGSARIDHAARERSSAKRETREHELRMRQLDLRRSAIESRMAALTAEAEEVAAEVRVSLEREASAERTSLLNAGLATRLRGGARKNTSRKPRNTGSRQ